MTQDAGLPEDFQHLWKEGYSFRLGQYISRGFRIFFRYPFGFYFYFLIAMMILGTVYGFIMGANFAYMAASGMTVANPLAISTSYGSMLISTLSSIFTSILTAILFAGVYTVCYQISKEGKKEFGQMFSGFNQIKQISLLYLVQVLILSGLSILITIALPIEEFNIQDAVGETTYPDNPLSIYASLPAAYYWRLGSIILIYLFGSFIWQFSLPLLVLGKMKFWPAMESSRKIVFKRFFHFVLLALLIFALIIVLYLILILIVAGIIALVDAVGLTSGSRINTTLPIIIIVVMMISMLVLAFFVPTIGTIHYAAYEDIVIDNVELVDSRIEQIGKDEEGT